MTEEKYAKWIWNVAEEIVNNFATLKHVNWTAAGDSVKHRSAMTEEKYAKWIWNVAEEIVNNFATLKHVN